MAESEASLLAEKGKDKEKDKDKDAKKKALTKGVSASNLVKKPSGPMWTLRYASTVITLRTF